MNFAIDYLTNISPLELLEYAPMGEVIIEVISLTLSLASLLMIDDSISLGYSRVEITSLLNEIKP
jgi:hypothetical protein